jgi:hypothetical protein
MISEEATAEKIADRAVELVLPLLAHPPASRKKLNQAIERAIHQAIDEVLGKRGAAPE